MDRSQLAWDAIGTSSVPDTWLTFIALSLYLYSCVSMKVTEKIPEFCFFHTEPGTIIRHPQTQVNMKQADRETAWREIKRECSEVQGLGISVEMIDDPGRADTAPVHLRNHLHHTSFGIA